MSEFGEAFREVRTRRGLSQADFAAALGNEVSRSTVAGIENGHQAPSPGVWAALSRHLPDEAEQLQLRYGRARAAQEQAETERRRRAQRQPRPPTPTPEAPADYVFERYDVIYIFGASRSPEEVIELRRLRALSKGAHDFGLQFSRPIKGFGVETQVLFGGEIVAFDVQELRRNTLIMNLVEFGRTLRKGQCHSFGVRYIVERNPELEAEENIAVATMDYRMEEVGVHANFWGSQQPRLCWAYEGQADEEMVGTPEDGVPLTLNRHHMASAEFRRPVTGTHFGIAWRW